jgi:hypothetical protein
VRANFDQSLTLRFHDSRIVSHARHILFQLHRVSESGKRSAPGLERIGQLTDGGALTAVSAIHPIVK